jgi:tetratricopeptide (TPR) repeat protein
MRIAASFALVFLCAGQLCAQGRRFTPRNQITDSPAGVLDSSGGAPAHSASYASTPFGALSVPASQLRIPSKALKEFQRSEKAYHAGDLRASADHLEKAVQIYPDFVYAHNMLGVRYAALGRYEDSLAEYQRSLAIDPHAGETYHNLAVVLFFMGRYGEAEEPARRAMELLPQEPATRYVLGCILVKREKITPEAVRLLTESAAKFPNALLVLAQVSWKQGHVDEVVADLRAYLQNPEPQNKQKIETWLAQLTRESAAMRAVPSSPPSLD